MKKSTQGTNKDLTSVLKTTSLHDKKPPTTTTSTMPIKKSANIASS